MSKMNDGNPERGVLSGYPIQEIARLWSQFKARRPDIYKEMIEFSGNEYSNEDVDRAGCYEDRVAWFIVELIEGGEIELPAEKSRDGLSSEIRFDIVKYAYETEAHFLLKK